MEVHTIVLVMSAVVLQSSTQYKFRPLECKSEGDSVRYLGLDLQFCPERLCDMIDCAPPWTCKVRKIYKPFQLSHEAECRAAPKPAPLARLDPQLSNAEKCAEPSVTGRCRAIIQRFYYNSVHHTCEAFSYGGCGGNHNNFESMDECINACLPRSSFVDSNANNNNGNNNNSDDGNTNTNDPAGVNGVNGFLRSLVSAGK